MAAESLPEHRLQAEVGLFRVVRHNHEERHCHNQTGGNQQLPLWTEKKCTGDKAGNDINVFQITSKDIQYNTTRHSNLDRLQDNFLLE